MFGLDDVKKVNVDGEEVCLKKGKLGWRVVYPPSDKDGKIKWFNLLTGGWRNLIKISIYIIIAILIYIGMSNTINQCSQTLALCTEECEWIFNEGGLLNG